MMTRPASLTLPSLTPTGLVVEIGDKVVDRIALTSAHHHSTQGDIISNYQQTYSRQV